MVGRGVAFRRRRGPASGCLRASNLRLVLESDEAEGNLAADGRPVLAVDVDGVISLFGFAHPHEDSPCDWHLFDGTPHCVSRAAGQRLGRLAEHFELVWATGWEDRANDHLPHALGIAELPTLHFGPDARFGTAHWKLGPIGEYASGRPLAWIDDNLDESCFAWAQERAEPTLLVVADSERGIEEGHVEALIGWVEAGYTPP